MDSFNLFSGITGTLTVVVLSSIIPLAVGSLLTIFAVNNSKLEKIFSWISMPFECLCPILLVLVIYFYLPPSINHFLGVEFFANPLFSIVLTLSLCFVGYMPNRVNQSYSALKNIICNGIGLVRSLFMWSFAVSSMIGYKDLVSYSKMMMARTYYFEYYLIPFVFAAIVIAILEVSRRLVKQYMK